MGILDDAIKEHLELKRQHGAGESELKQLEDEAFGAAERPGGGGSAPDPLAEAPTEFMAQPDLDEKGEQARAEADSPAEDDIGASESGASEPAEAQARGRTEIADLQEPPEVEPRVEAGAAEEPAAVEESAEEAPADEHAPAIEHELPAPEPMADAPEPPSGPSTEERHAIAEQPTEMYDIEEELGDAEPEVHALSEEDEEFWDEKRLSDELDQALEAPIEPEVVSEPEQAAEASPDPEEPEEVPAAEASAPGDETGQAAAPRGRGGEEDVLEETPDFLEEAPEDDQLWFEQKPPKDFDFDD